jgi:peptidoglycan/LPS O-acetylase OafA/YrhL
VLFVVALVLRVVLLWRGVSTDAVCVLAPTRLDGLVVGAMIACVQRGGGLGRLVGPAKVACVLIPIALLAMGVSVGRFTLNDHPVLTAGVSLAAVLFGAMVVLAVAGDGVWVVRRVMGNRFLRWTGKYSYALYLLHWPVLAVVMYGLFKIDEVPLVLGSRLFGAACFYAVSWTGAYVLAMVSWRVWESPFLALKRFVPRPG